MNWDNLYLQNKKSKKNGFCRFLRVIAIYISTYLPEWSLDFKFFPLRNAHWYNVQQGLVSLLCRPSVVLRDVPFAQPWSESKLSMWEFNFFCFETRDYAC